MKNIKKLFLMSFFAIAALVLVGMTDVKAAGDLKFSGGSDVVCDPSKVAPGEPSLCYFVGKPGSTTESMYGYIMHAFTTKKLKLVGVETAVQGAQAVYTELSSTLTDQSVTKQADMTDNVAAFKCTYVTDASLEAKEADITDYGCGIFYTTKNTTSDAFTGASVVEAATSLNLTSKLASGYGVVGAFKVELDETATATECGEICVKVFGAPTDAQFNASASEEEHYKTCGVADTPNAGCGVVSNNVSYDCIEVSYQGSGELPSQSPPTGAFASYALLVAGALIAISAIALAKKNNKLYRV